MKNWQSISTDSKKTNSQTGPTPVAIPPQICHTNSMNKINPTLLLNDSAFIDALQGLQSFVLETGADLDMAYDWVCEMSQPFVHDDAAYSCFYDVYAEAAE